MSENKSENKSEKIQVKKFVMFGPHMIQANQIDRVTCQPYTAERGQSYGGIDLRWVCTAYLPDRLIHTVVPSHYDATELNKKLLQDLNKIMK